MRSKLSSQSKILSPAVSVKGAGWVFCRWGAKKEKECSENKGISSNRMETGRITNARDHLRKINKCGIQHRDRTYIYMQTGKTNWL